MKLFFVSLGCARNQVDSEVMLGSLEKAGVEIVPEPQDAEIIVVNTCSFIEAAADESIDTILALARWKTEGVCRRLIVAGCLPERYREDIAEALPEVDQFLGTGAFHAIVDAVMSPPSPVGCLLPDPDSISVQSGDAERFLPDGAMAYVKIAEGCSKNCTFCIIPKLRGLQKSRRPEDILEESERLVAGGIRELVLVAQDTTAYGSDLGSGVNLDFLLRNLSAIHPDIWIRFLYGHPESIRETTIRTIADLPNVCSYYDLPIQHASAGVLRRMGRHYDPAALLRLFCRIRELDPGAALRTTVIVGFPGETDHDFQELVSFAREIRFDHLGVFSYSDAADLPSHHLDGHVPAAKAARRNDRLMSVQMGISEEKNKKRIGQSYRVLVEESPEPDLYIGRTCFQAPEVDGVTLIDAPRLYTGEFVDVTIRDAMEYDLMGVVA
jgi:ribosomal protein S12 methylthiotransferase